MMDSHENGAIDTSCHLDKEQKKNGRLIGSPGAVGHSVTLLWLELRSVYQPCVL